MNRKKHICDVCNDTHRMRFGDRESVMCTHCPAPCQKCRAGGNGPYCEKTPCDCFCHANDPRYPRPDRAEGERIRLEHALENVEAVIKSTRIALTASKRDGPIGIDIAQSLMEAAGRVAMGLAKLDAYQRAQDDQGRRSDG